MVAESIPGFAHFFADWAKVSLTCNMVHFNVISQICLWFRGELAVRAAPQASQLVLRHLSVYLGVVVEHLSILTVVVSPLAILCVVIQRHGAAMLLLLL